MGAHPYWYTVDYADDHQRALQMLRAREFMAGRYNPVLPFPEFPITSKSPRPGAKHASIEEAMAAAEEDGTRSILDIERIADAPDFCAAAPLSDEELHDYFGTTEPTLDMVEDNMDFLEEVERGHAIYFTLYADGEPDQLFFAGYSFD